jgi:hypothetical protein
MCGGNEYYQQALNGCKKTLGEGHPSTLDTAHSMARVSKGKGEYNRALEWYQRALDGQEKTLGKDHPSTLTQSTTWPWYLKEKKCTTGRWSGISGLLIAVRRSSERVTLRL